MAIEIGFRYPFKRIALGAAVAMLVPGGAEKFGFAHSTPLTTRGGRIGREGGASRGDRWMAP